MMHRLQPIRCVQLMELSLQDYGLIECLQMAQSKTNPLSDTFRITNPYLLHY